MNPQLDKLIADIDAVINGEDPGAVGSGDLAPEVKEKNARAADTGGD